MEEGLLLYDSKSGHYVIQPLHGEYIDEDKSHIVLYPGCNIMIQLSIDNWEQTTIEKINTDKVWGWHFTNITTTPGELIGHHVRIKNN